MANPGSSGAARSRAWPWLVVALTFLMYLAAVVGLDLAGLPTGVPMPWWAAQALPPIVYAALVCFVVRPRSAAGLATGTAVLWVVHLAVGVLTVAVRPMLGDGLTAGLASALPPPALPQLFWVPVMLVPLKHWLAPAAEERPTPAAAAVPRPAAERRATPVTPPAKPASAPVKPAFERRAAAPPRSQPARSVISMEPGAGVGRRPAPTPPPALTAPPPAPPAAEEVAPQIAAASVPDTPSPRPANRDEAPALEPLDPLAAKDGSNEPVRVSFDRVRAQLPAEALARELREIGGELPVPGTLVVPRQLVRAQLANGAVRVRWREIAAQIPASSIAMSHEDIEARLPDGHIALPLDEVVPQFRAAVFALDTPELDLSAIEGFPEPFRPLADAEAGAAASAEDELGILRPAEIAAPPETGLASPSAGRTSDERATAGAPPAGPAADERLSTEATAPPLAVSAPATGDEAALADSSHHPLGGISESAVDRQVLGLRDALSAFGPISVFALTGNRVRDSSSGATGVGAPDDRAIGIATRLLPVLEAHRPGWPVDQVTLRGPDAALVLTTIGGAPGTVLAAMAPRGTTLALLELRCRQAAERHAGACSTPRGGMPAGSDSRGGSHLQDVPPPASMRGVVPALTAFGAVEPSAWRPSGATGVLCLFTPPGSDARAAAALANDVANAMRGASDLFRSAMLRSGARRMVIQWPATASGADVIAAAGETARPGLACRQVEDAAAALAAR